MTPGTTYRQVGEELEQLRGELVEEHVGHVSRKELAKWADDSVGWGRESGRNPTEYQVGVMRSVEENKLTAWRGCHSCGKEFTIGSLAVWAAYARGMKVLVVSATEQQVIGQTMTEVRRAWRDAREAHGIGGQLFQGSVRIGGEDRIIALTGSANVDALTGWHDAENGVLVAISEGQGERLEAAAYDAAFGNVTTDKGRILAAGNPVRPEGRFYEAHQKAHWNQFQTSASDTPNVKAGEMVRSGFPAPDWPKQVAREYGQESAFYRGRVEAEFPDTAEDSLINRAWIEEAFDRHREGFFEPDARRSMAVVGIDVARFGNDASVACVRRGSRVLEFRRWQGEDTKETAARALQVIREHHDPHEAPVETVVVDSVGIGAGVADQLRDELDEIRYVESDRRGRAKPRTASLTEFNAGEKAPDDDRFKRLRAQSYWHLRKRLEEERLSLPPSDELKKELLALRTKVTPDGRVALASKRAGLRGDSPDRADALSMTFRPDLDPGGSWYFYNPAPGRRR